MKDISLWSWIQKILDKQYQESHYIFKLIKHIYMSQVKKSDPHHSLTKLTFNSIFCIKKTTN